MTMNTSHETLYTIKIIMHKTNKGIDPPRMRWIINLSNKKIK